MADETTRVDAWLYELLHDDTDLLAALATQTRPGLESVVADVAPTGTVFPVVVYQHQGSVDVRTATGSGRIMVTGLWIVKVVGETANYGELVAAADRLDALLEESNGGPAGSDGAVFTSVRESPFRFAEDDGGVSYRYLGGTYRIWAQVPA